MKEGIDHLQMLVIQNMERRGCSDAHMLPITRNFVDVLRPLAQCLEKLIMIASKTIIPTLEQFLIFLLGTKKQKVEKSKPQLMLKKEAKRMDAALIKDTAKEYVSNIVKGVSDLKLKDTQKRYVGSLGLIRVSVGVTILCGRG